jgi:lysozyme
MMKFEKNDGWKLLVVMLIAIGVMFIMFYPHHPKTAEKTVGTKAKQAYGFAQILTVPNEAKDLIRKHEGVKDTVYPDTKGIPTIGIGFNLHREDAKSRITSLGLDYKSVLDGSVSLTDRQIEKLFEYDFIIAVGAAGNFLPTFQQQPREIKIVLVDMAYNLGGEGLGRFLRFRQALLEQDYKKAANEMVNSKWYYQVGDRSKELVSMVRSV